MVNVPVIARRELNTYFLSPLAYVVLTGFALVHGIMVCIYIRSPEGVIDPDLIAGGAFWVAFILMIPAAPIITMRLLSEEASSGTMETLMTTPVSDAEVVLGKYLGALIFSMVMFVPILFEVIFLRALGELDYGPIASGSLGLFLLAAQFLAIGILCSATTEMQIGSAIVNFAVLLGLFFVWFLIGDRTSNVAEALKYLAPPMHFASFLKGVIDSRDVVYFAATTVFFLYLTVRVMEFKKWR